MWPSDKEGGFEWPQNGNVVSDPALATISPGMGTDPVISPPKQDVGGSEALVGWREPCCVVGIPRDKQGWYHDGNSIKQYCSVVTSNFLTGLF